MIEIDVLQKTWKHLGEVDPLWAILTYPGKAGGKWNPGDFFASGRTQLREILEGVRQYEFPRRRALDFGCGVGRLTQALCEHFEECTGVDISAPMLALANQHNRFPTRCRYIENTAPDLGFAESEAFDFVLSLIVLQHMRPPLAEIYLREMIRVLSPGGLLAVQVPSEPSVPPVEGPCVRLPKSGLRAEISVEPSRLHLAPGETIELTVQIRNAGDVVWPSKGQGDWLYLVRLANHWLNSSGEVIRLYDGRTNLPRDIEPGEEMSIPLSIKAPEAEGEYLVELDLLQEGVTWFGSEGSPTLRLPVRVAGKAPELKTEDPQMEMHGVPTGEIESVIAETGGRLLRKDQDELAGPEWVSYTYFVTK